MHQFMERSLVLLLGEGTAGNDDECSLNKYYVGSFELDKISVLEMDDSSCGLIYIKFMWCMDDKGWFYYTS